MDVLAEANCGEVATGRCLCGRAASAGAARPTTIAPRVSRNAVGAVLLYAAAASARQFTNSPAPLARIQGMPGFEPALIAFEIFSASGLPAGHCLRRCGGLPSAVSVCLRVTRSTKRSPVKLIAAVLGRCMSIRGTPLFWMLPLFSR